MRIRYNLGFIIAISIAGWLVANCTSNKDGNEENTEAILRDRTEKYFEAWNRHDFTHPDFSKFKNDTSYTWHSAREGEGIRSIFNPNSGWKQWDKAWNGTYSFEITHINTDSLIVTGRFKEVTDFMKIVGIPEGLNATVTYWFDENYKVVETLYGWSEDNKSVTQMIKPIVGWATENDSIRIQRIYLQDGFVANAENARDWKILLEAYEDYD